jgi:hypothetical protein
MSAQDSSRVGAQDYRYPTMGVLNTQRSLPDSKLEFGEEQGPSKGDQVLRSEIKTSTIHRN